MSRRLAENHFLLQFIAVRVVTSNLCSTPLPDPSPAFGAQTTSPTRSPVSSLAVRVWAHTIQAGDVDLQIVAQIGSTVPGWWTNQTRSYIFSAYDIRIQYSTALLTLFLTDYLHILHCISLYECTFHKRIDSPIRSDLNTLLHLHINCITVRGSNNNNRTTHRVFHSIMYGLLYYYLHAGRLCIINITFNIIIYIIHSPCTQADYTYKG